MHSNTSQKIIGLDHLRALAIVMVLVYHYRMFPHPEWIDTYGRFGWMGVDLFFVLSGFLISKQLFEQIKISNEIRFKEFYVKRFFRIIPPYAAVLILYFSFPLFREREALPPLWKFITFTQNIELDIKNFGTFSHAWSLCIEEQFYLLFPLFLFIFFKFKKLNYIPFLLLFLLFLTIISRIISWQVFIIPNLNSTDFWKIWYMKIYYPTYTRLDGFVVGILIAYFFKYSGQFRNFIHSNGNLLLILGLTIVFFSFWICLDQMSKPASIIGFTIVASGFGLIVMSAISKSSILNKKQSLFSERLAALSYSIYLSHKGIIHLTHFFIANQNIDSESSFVLIISLANCILIGYVFQYLIEKPSSKIKNYLLKINSKNHENN
ncbi:acyltransferase [Flavobacterium sp.]|uniref:acyltransferase family protein n=1 Tax=Flavobacterium sp. TaxID=239 RepID=UPI0031D91019